MSDAWTPSWEETLAVETVFGGLVGVPQPSAVTELERLLVPQRLTLLFARAVTRGDDRMRFGAMHAFDGRLMWAAGKLIFTLGDVRTRGPEGQLEALLTELTLYARPRSSGRVRWQRFFDESLPLDVCFHLLKLWGLELRHWSAVDSRLLTAAEAEREKLTRVQQRVLAFADVLEGRQAENPKVVDVGRMPPLFQVTLGALLMATGMYRLTGEREHVDRWIRYVKGERIEYDRWLILSPGVRGLD